MGLCIEKNSLAEAKESMKSGTRALPATIGKTRTLGSGNAAMKISELGFGCMGLNYHRSEHPDRKFGINLSCLSGF